MNVDLTNLRLNMNDKVLCQTFVLILSRFERSWKMKFSRKLFKRFWLRLISRFKFSIVRYTDHVARSFWCWKSMILSFDINKKIIVVLSETSFCFSHHQFSMCISKYILSLSSLNCRMKEYERFAENDECSMKNLISFIVSILNLNYIIQFIVYLERNVNILFNSFIVWNFDDIIQLT